MGKHEKKENKKTKEKILILIILLLLLIILLLIFFWKKPKNASGGIGLEIDKNAGEYVAPANQENVDSKNVAIPGWGSLKIPANKTEVTVDFYNPDENKDLYYLTFELRLPNDSEQGYEVLYKSDLVEPGLHIQNITLSKSLKKGTYDAVIHVQPYRMDKDKTATNNADMQTKLIVE